MTDKLASALALAADGFHVFPLEPDSKLPAIMDYPGRATRDAAQIRAWWTCPVMGLPLDRNVGISTTRFGDDGALLVVDVDNKGNKHGDEAVAALKLEGLVLPSTRSALTPTGGRHLFYSVVHPVTQGANVLGAGVDIRSFGGYVVGIGSTLGRGTYHAGETGPVVEAPQWLIDRCKPTAERNRRADPAPDQAALNPDRAAKRALEYLRNLEPVTAGGRNEAGFRVAAKLKDLGVARETCAEMLATHWHCNPPLDSVELDHVVRSAYEYGQNSPGCDAPEVQFSPVSTNAEQSKTVDADLHPFDKLNMEYAYTLTGGSYVILWETRDEKGRQAVRYLDPSAFKTKFPGAYMPNGKRQVPLPQAWLEWPDRRSYDAVCFLPGLAPDSRFYNLWRGFAVQPAPAPYRPHKAVDMFLDHARDNVCGGDPNLARWLIGYFAHMVQRPWEKPLVALVFKGSKGTGKNALVERVGHLFGAHFAVADDSRYLTSQFNSHLENSLFLVFDEAFWSGDKKAEGKLKGLITGTDHLIERKGYEPYKVDNRTRVAIIGNEHWLVPASHDERRYAVFQVGEGRKQDRAYFQEMREGMEQGGYSYLLRYLLDYPIQGLDLNEAPSTEALLEQKHASLDPIHEWWLECLSEGSIAGGDFSGWPAEAETDRIRQALQRYFQKRNIRSRIPGAESVGRLMHQCAPSLTHKRARRGTGLVYVYSLPTLEASRTDWESFIGHKVTWE